VKPEAQPATDLHVITDHGNSYTFNLNKASGAESHYDAKLFIVAADSDMRANLSKPPVWITAEEATKIKATAEQERAAADQAIAKAKAQGAEAAETARESYPQTLRFDYVWDRKKGDALGVRQIYRDDKFTYIQANPQEAPALYEIKDGKPSLTSFDLRNGVYTVTKLLDQGYLAIGKQKVDFRRETAN
jgi:type IV secretion system protein VirB9